MPEINSVPIHCALRRPCRHRLTHTKPTQPKHTPREANPVDIVIERATELSIKHIIVFTANGEGVFLLKDNLGDSDITAHAAIEISNSATLSRGLAKGSLLAK